MAAGGKLSSSKRRMRESSAAKGGAKSSFSKQTKRTGAKHFKKKGKASHLKHKIAKPNQSVKPGSGQGAVMDPAGDLGDSKKRKRNPAVAKEGGKPKFLKQSKSAGAMPFSKTARANHLKSSEKDVVVPMKKEAKTPKERRLEAKEKSEARKIKRKPNYTLEKELTSLWEKMRCYNIGKEERSKLVSEALRKMSGKLLEVASSHVSARVLQTCVKYGSQEERNVIFEELQPHLLTLSRKKYAVHLVKKLLDAASKTQLEGFISSLHGHVSFLIRHIVGSAVVEHAYHLANRSQRQRLLMEMYSTELQLFKDLTLTNSGSLAYLISKLKLQKSSVLQHMTSIIQPLLEKGIVDYSIIHATLVEYFTIADKSSAADVIQQLLPLLSQESVTDDSPHASSKRKNKRRKMRIIPLVNMMHTRDGLKVGILCIKHGTAKDRKKIVKGIKDHIRKLALDQYGSLLLSCIISVVDDTKLVTKVIIRELQSMLKELVLDKNGRRPLLLLLHPQCHRYFTPEDLACLNSTVPSLCTQDEMQEGASEAGPEKVENDTEAIMTHNGTYEDSMKSMQSAVGGKKDALVRRKEVLVESGLAECLIETCMDTADELLRSNFGREVIFEVAVGGSDGVLQSLNSRLADLHKAIATAAAASPNSEESEEDHLFQNFHSSRTIRKLVLESPSFAEILWKMALEGNSDKWAKGHSCKVVSAFLESSEPSVRDLAKSELQPLVDSGILKLSERK